MNTDDRLKKSAGENKTSRVLTESREVTENREITDRDRLDMLRQSFYQNQLPDLPPIPGYHVCWLTTNNPRDPIQTRKRLGYELLTVDEVPGFEHVSTKSGDFAGYVGVNEMVAAKIRVDLYEMFMRETHHAAPLRLDGKLEEAREQIENMTGNQGLTSIVDPQPSMVG